MKAEKMHKHLEPDLGPSPAVIPSPTDSTGNEMHFTRSPMKGRQVVHGAGWVCWLSLTRRGCLKIPPQVPHEPSSELPGRHSLPCCTFKTPLKTLSTEEGISSTCASCPALSHEHQRASAAEKTYSQECCPSVNAKVIFTS